MFHKITSNSKVHKLVWVSLLLPFFSISQNCSCESNFDWVKKTFEENDAGFSYTLNKKGLDSYVKHNEKTRQNVKSITDPGECTTVLREWLGFFRSGHVSIERLKQDNTRTLSDKEIVELYKDTEKIDIDLNTYSEYLKSKKEVDYEGVWINGPYKIGIKKIENNFIGFIIEADGVYWKKGQVKLKINANSSAVYYMKDHSGQKFSNAELWGNNYIKLGYITLQRIAPKFNDSPIIKQYFESIRAQGPYIEIIDENTAYLRLPSFRRSEKQRIDSVIKVNKGHILKTHNLIIDIRNNGGGSDVSYQEILPILYTNPIRIVGEEYLSTSLNNRRMLDFIEKDDYGFDEEMKKWAKESYDKLSFQLGKFVNVDSTAVTIKKYDTIYKYPKNVGIIINKNNGSSAEQFLLAAKQSSKVKLFGTSTYGVLDISNMYFVESPCQDYKLGYSLTRSLRIPDMAIDDTGIQPDYYLGKNIPKYKWLEFVLKTLNK